MLQKLFYSSYMNRVTAQWFEAKEEKKTREEEQLNTTPSSTLEWNALNWHIFYILFLFHSSFFPSSSIIIIIYSFSSIFFYFYLLLPSTCMVIKPSHRAIFIIFLLHKIQNSYHSSRFLCFALSGIRNVILFCFLYYWFVFRIPDSLTQTICTIFNLFFL